MMSGLKRQLNLLAVGVILAVSLFISLAAVVAMDRLADQLSAARMLSELGWVRSEVVETHRILKDTGVDTLKTYLDSAQQEIIQRFQDFRIGDTGRLYLVSDDGRIVSAPSDGQATDLDGPALELVIQEKVGHTTLMIAGSPSIVYFDTFPEWGWRILLVISEKEINAKRDSFILMAILILLFSACAGVFVFARVANGFVLPILELAEKFSRMKEDQLGQQLEVKHRSKEVGILLRAFHRLSDRLLAAKKALQEQNEELQVREEELQSQNEELLSAAAMQRQSDQRHRSILQTAMDGIWLTDEQGRFVEVNGTYCRMSGYSMQELLTMSIADVECRETASDTAAHIKKIMALGEDRFESQHRRKDGSIYDVEVSVQYRSADGGQLVVFVQDISERKQAETALRESETKFRAMVETFPLAIYQSVGVEQITEYMNPTMVKLFGYTQADIPSVAQWWPLVYPDETYRRQIAEEWTKKVKHAIATQSPIEPMEVVCTCKDGSKKNISWSYITLGDKNYACGLDITERKQAAEALLASEKHLRSIFESMTEMVVLHDLVCDDNGRAVNYRILDCNPAFTRITGIRRVDAVGRLATDVYGSDTAPYLDEYARVAMTGEPCAFITSYAPMDKHFDIHAASPGTNRFVTVTTDITKRKLAEDELKRQKTQLEQRNRALRQFNYAVSHELKTPLVSIESSLGLIQSTLPQSTDPELTRAFGYARTATRQMNNLLESLLLMFRIDAAENGTETAAFGVLVQDAVDQLTRENRLKGINVAIAAGGPELCGDRHKLVQIWLQLVENAAKYMGDQKDPAIAIGFEQTDLEVLFFVRDNGLGIEQPYQGKIFGLFDQLDKTAGGTGLGLTLVQRIVDYYGGSIRVESAGTGQGSCFYFTLPNILINKDTTT